MSIFCVEHLSFEGRGQIADWAGANEAEIQYSNPYRAGKWQPPPSGTKVLIITGGAMNVDQTDKYPWLADEMDCIRSYVEQGRKVLGICLGAQLIAQALGGQVGQNKQKEIGWHAVDFRTDVARPQIFDHFPGQMMAFHWHSYHVSQLPTGAKCLASSQCTPVQAYCIGDNVAAFQFHPEFNEDMLASSIEKHGHELTGGPYEQKPRELQAGYKKHAASNHRVLSAFLDLFILGV